MKLFITALLFLTSFASQAVETVEYVDLNQYLGRWYQIARNPMLFEPRNCVCAQQTLTLEDSGVVGVYNSCRKGSPEGELTDIQGTAKVTDPVSNAKLVVDFGLPFKGTYWIIGLHPEYKWAVVTDKDARSLYILSKTPMLSDELYQEALQAAEAQVPINKLLETSQVGCTYPPM